MTLPPLTVIEASAGTGKTFALVTRLLQLIFNQTEPERIVALTFSRMAAGEIFNSFIERLSRAAADPATAAAESERVGQTLTVDDFRDKAHIAVGLLGVPIFTQWATEQRQSDLMATILRQPDYPGYLNMINHGATATWESWDSERSRVHNCYNGIGTWFYQAIAGIRPDVAAPGYRHFFIDPQVTDGVTWVKASKPTPYGDIRVELDGNSLRITVPVGTTATVYPGTPSQQTLPAGQWTIK